MSEKNIGKKEILINCHNQNYKEIISINSTIFKDSIKNINLRNDNNYMNKEIETICYNQKNYNSTNDESTICINNENSNKKVLIKTLIKRNYQRHKIHLRMILW
jgi:hypothetical protein